MVNRRMSFMETFALTGIAASVSVTATAPIERVKLILQTQGEILKSGRLDTPYRGMYDCTKRIFISEGPLAFWRGNMVNVIRYFPNQIVTQTLKDKTEDALSFWNPRTRSSVFAKHLFSGGTAGALSLILFHPLDYARTRLATDVKVNHTLKPWVPERQFKGLTDVVMKTVATDGYQGLYRGFGVTCAGVFAMRGMTFGLFDTFRPILYGNNPSFTDLVMLGYGASAVSNVLHYPFDTVRRRMMLTSCEDKKYTGALDCTAQIVKKEGVRGLFKGVLASVVKSAAGAVVLAGYNKLEGIYRRWRLSG